MSNETPNPAPAAPPSPQNPPRRFSWKLIAGAVLLVIVLLVAIPKVLHALHTTSTDDAYVNSYVTFVAPRVTGQVARVFVDDNNRVRKGDALVALDPEPYQVQVAIKQAAVDSAQADLVVANANIRAAIGQVRSARFKLVRAIEDVDNQVAVIRARAAAWEQAKATLVLAQAEFDRAQRLLSGKVVSSRGIRSETRDARRVESPGLPGVGECIPGAGRAGPARPATRGQKPDRSAAGPRPDVLLGARGAGDPDPGRRAAGHHSRLPTISRRSRWWMSSISAIPSGDADKIYAELIKNAPDAQTIAGRPAAHAARPRSGPARSKILHGGRRDRRRGDPAQREPRQ